MYPAFDSKEMGKSTPPRVYPAFDRKEMGKSTPKSDREDFCVALRLLYYLLYYLLKNVGGGEGGRGIIMNAIKITCKS